MRWLWLVLLSACGFTKSARNTGDDVPNEAGIIDAEIDAPPDAFDDKCFGSGTFYVCLAAPPTGNRALGSGTFDTTACTGTGREKAMIGTQQVCVVSGATLTVGMTTTVAAGGTLPLVFVAETMITITGTVDASSVINTNGTLNLGPGANAPACNSTGINGAADGNGGGGGAGGTFGTKGGDGGDGAVVASGGLATTPPTKANVLRGGCPGGVGAGGTSNATQGPGGGAVYFVTRGTIMVTGTINASGGGGGAGLATNGGGGGGGSGGMIVFHAMTLNVAATAVVVSNGGGGGGGTNNGGATGGGDPDPLMPLAPALGSTAAGAGESTGGNGAAGNVAATAGGAQGAGGGGGGGGLGLTRVLRGGMPALGMFSPAPVN